MGRRLGFCWALHVTIYSYFQISSPLDVQHLFPIPCVDEHSIIFFYTLANSPKTDIIVSIFLHGCQSLLLSLATRNTSCKVVFPCSTFCKPSARIDGVLVLAYFSISNSATPVCIICRNVSSIGTTS